MSKEEEDFIKEVKRKYDEYFLAKCQATPTSGFPYKNQVTAFIEWLEGKPIKEQL